MKILIVDDEAMIREVLCEYAQFEGYETEQAENGMDAILMCKNTNFDLVIMDIMMPKLDGFSAVKEIKKLYDVPVLMLSARAEEYDKLFGFEIGVDDYVVKPFSPKEVMARVNAIIKRKSTQNSDESQDILKFEGLEIDILGRNVYIDGEKIELTPKEYDLLKYLMQNRNIALSRENLLNNIWGYDFYGDDRTIDTHIKTLRGRLGVYRDKIKTVRGMGYKFEDQEN